MLKYEILKKLRDESRVNLYTRRIVFCLVIMLGLYIWQVNGMATMGYEIKDLEEQKAGLQKINQELQLRVTEAQSSAKIIQRLEALEMIPVYSVTYVDISSSGVAKR